VDTVRLVATSSLPSSIPPGGAAAQAQAQRVERRVRAAVTASQMLLVVRILSLLLIVPLLPDPLPTISFHLGSSHLLTVPLGWLSSGSLFLVIALISTVELYLVARLADRLALARSGVLFVESLAIVATAGALALGATLAVLPLAAAVGSTSLLLRNEIRWAFILRPRQADLPGRRQGGVYVGYAGAPLDVPKPPQAVGYSASRLDDR
jgi:hypothetical protein